MHSNEGIKALKEKQIEPSTIQHRTCFKAQLFTPYKSIELNITPLNSNCIVGFWINFKRFNLAEFNSFEYYMPYKSEWVLIPNNDVAWKSHQEIMLDIHLKMIEEIAPMIWIKKSETNFEKCFVVWW